jgi:mRNA interferase RelE/StbE
LAWSVDFSRTAKKQFARIDRTWQVRILDYLESDVANLEDPRSRGKMLSGEFAGLWRFRIGDYRAICQIADSTVTILAPEIGHRRNVYK